MIEKLDSADSQANEVGKRKPVVLAANAPVEASTEEKLRYLSITDWAGKTREVEWLWEELIPLRHLTILQSAHKAGKSTLVRNLIACVVEGGELLGRKVLKGSVLYLPLEEEPSSVREHLRRLGVPTDAPVVVPALVRGGGKYTPQSKQVVRNLETLEMAIRDNRPTLVVIDPLTLFVRPSSLNSYDKVYAAMEPFIALANRYHCAIVFLHHEGKTARSNVGQRGIGSVALPAVVSTTISLRSRNGVRSVDAEGRGIRELRDLVIRMDENGAVYASSPSNECLGETLAPRVLDAMRGRARPFTMEEVLGSVHGDEKDIRTVVYDLIDTGYLLHVEGRGVRNDPKRYALSDAPPLKVAEG